MRLEKILGQEIDFKKSGTQKIIILILLAALIAILLMKDGIVTTLNSYEMNKEWLKLDYKKEYSGRVVTIKKDKWNRNNMYLQLNDSSKIFEDEERVISKIKVGDSVFKKAGSGILYIVKQDEVLQIHYDDLYKYRDSIIRKNAGN